MPPKRAVSPLDKSVPLKKNKRQSIYNSSDTAHAPVQVVITTTTGGSSGSSSGTNSASSLFHDRMTARDMKEWLPHHLVQIVKKSEPFCLVVQYISYANVIGYEQNMQDWQARTRFFTAYLFSRSKAYSSSQRAMILNLLQPPSEHILCAANEDEFFKSVIIEIQQILCQAHENLARAVLDFTSTGQTYMNSAKAAKSKKKKLTIIESGQLEDLLQLSPDEVRSLWTPLIGVVDSSIWDPSRWNEHESNSRYIFNSLKASSYDILARFITTLQGLPNSQRDLSSVYRTTCLKFVSIDQEPGCWPALPPSSTGELPTSRMAWSLLSGSFTTCYEDPYYTALFAQIHKDAASFLLSVRPKADHEEIAAFVDHLNVDEPIIINLDDENNRPLFPIGPEVNSEQNPEGFKDIDSVMDTAVLSEHSPATLRIVGFNNDGMPIPNVQESDSDDPLSSTHMASEQSEDPTVDLIIESLRESGYEDRVSTELIAAALMSEYAEPGVIVPRAVKVSTLGPIGLARYTIGVLRENIELYDALIHDLDQKRIEALELIANIEIYRTKAQELRQETNNLTATKRHAHSLVSTGRRDLATLMRERNISTNLSHSVYHPQLNHSTKAGFHAGNKLDSIARNAATHGTPNSQVRGSILSRTSLASKTAEPDDPLMKAAAVTYGALPAKASGTLLDVNESTKSEALKPTPVTPESNKTSTSVYNMPRSINSNLSTSERYRDDLGE
ncbi:hypothetical protein EDC01DRAFT_629334 [Geopyxis carbonaria]|nr:hypothetical protein EDC01DRAFT_629334 [Geopyxis carbonaria]